MSLTRKPPQHTATLPPFVVGQTDDVAENDHWVSHLFPPTYSHNDEHVGTRSSDEMKTILGNRLTAIDPEVLRNVFHRVHALLLHQREMVAAGTLDTVASSLQDAAPESVTAQPVSVDDSSIWDEGELDVIRKAYKIIRDENRHLRIELDLTQQRLSDLDITYHEIRHAHDIKSALLHEANQANSRHHILAATLKKELDLVTSEVVDLRKQLKAQDLEHLNLIDELKSTRVASNQAKMDKKLLELKVRECGKTMLDTAAHLESRLRLKYEQRINELMRTIEDLEDELCSEKKTHAATRKGLDHLRTHFASLPIEQIPISDQLKNMDIF